MKVSLFPFLPVLLCMMGAMIMLLVVVAQSVREQAISPAAKTPETQTTMTVEEAEELRYKIDASAEEADWYAENYVIVRQNAEEELADLQAKLALAEKETQKIEDELARLKQLAQQLDTETQATPEEVEHLKRLLAQQQQRKEEAELELAELQKDAAQKEKSYAIVPYRGASGTYRRPIYIECGNGKVIIQPEGIELVPGDFHVLDRPDNPFDTALRVIRQYYMETNQTARGSEPYPLFIIRPSGVDMYDNALQATKNWVKDFGYEIVNEDWHIQYPEPDHELRRRIFQQLEIARSRLNNELIARRMADRTEGHGSGTVPQFRVDPRGNVVPTGEMMRGGEEIQRQLAANRQGIGPQGTVPQGTGQQGAEQQGTRQQGTGRQTGGQELSNVPSNPVVLRETAIESYTTPFLTYPTAPAERTVRNSREQIAPSAGASSQESAMAGQPMQPMQSSAQRPPNWALKDATQYSSGFSRVVVIRCEADRFVLAAQSGLAVERTIPIADSVSTAADRLVQAIWEFQASWGSAGENRHWRPMLRVRVVPGGEQRLRELKTLLKNSGLMIEE